MRGDDLGFVRDLELVQNIGGIGNVTGAMLGGFLLGILASLTVFYLDARWEQVVVFSVLVLILVFRPRGLLGEEV